MANTHLASTHKQTQTHTQAIIQFSQSTSYGSKKIFLNARMQLWRKHSDDQKEQKKTERKQIEKKRGTVRRAIVCRIYVKVSMSIHQNEMNADWHFKIGRASFIK